MAAGAKKTGAVRPGELRVLTAEEYQELTPAEKGSYTKALRKLGKENEHLPASRRSKGGAGDMASSNGARKQAPTTTAIDDTDAKKSKPGVPYDAGGDEQGREPTAGDTEQLSTGGAIEPEALNGTAAIEEDGDSDIDAARRRKLAARGKRKQQVVSPSEDEGDYHVPVDGASGDKEADDDAEVDDDAPKTMTKSQKAKYSRTDSGAQMALNVRSKPIIIIDNFNDDNDDIDLVNAAHAQAREAVTSQVVAGSQVNNVVVGELVNGANRGAGQSAAAKKRIARLQNQATATGASATTLQVSGVQGTDSGADTGPGSHGAATVGVLPQAVHGAPVTSFALAVPMPAALNEAVASPNIVSGHATPLPPVTAPNTASSPSTLPAVTTPSNASAPSTPAIAAASAPPALSANPDDVGPLATDVTSASGAWPANTDVVLPDSRKGHMGTPVHVVSLKIRPVVTGHFISRIDL
ncbi:hypothetical protein FA95DRAFT_1578399 [Auriscalpium vulgare]|uniref:Uncharacterized protein n=1 Tax=Auriscalpium vulgare TaxID=40419 RepID=A0ACB8R1W4_9AGAM|nr:hypothetical protein FA95DRAFT_1578399 [Auriscalpium vulgare]